MGFHGAPPRVGAHAVGRSHRCGINRISPVHLVPGSACPEIIAGGDTHAMKPIREAAIFVRGVRKKLRAGELSREPLKLLRLEWVPERVECDWLMRPADAWDKDLPPRMAR